MRLQQTVEMPSMLPGPSSQTSTTWPLVMLEGNGKVVSQGVGYDVGGPRIQRTRERTTDDLIERILTEHAGAWEKLAEL